MRGFEREDAPPALAIGDVQLHALARVVAQCSEHRTRQLGQWKLVLGGLTKSDQLEAEAEAALWIAAKQAVLLERDSQSVSSGAREVRCLLERGEIERGTSERAQNENTFVNDANSAYTVH